MRYLSVMFILLLAAALVSCDDKETPQPDKPQDQQQSQDDAAVKKDGIGEEYQSKYEWTIQDTFTASVNPHITAHIIPDSEYSAITNNPEPYTRITQYYAEGQGCNPLPFDCTSTVVITPDEDL